MQRSLGTRFVRGSSVLSQCIYSAPIINEVRSQQKIVLTCAPMPATALRHISISVVCNLMTLKHCHVAYEGNSHEVRYKHLKLCSSDTRRRCMITSICPLQILQPTKVDIEFLPNSCCERSGRVPASGAASRRQLRCFRFRLWRQVQEF